jgi:ketosteroid isomerase-like protein
MGDPAAPGCGHGCDSALPGGCCVLARTRCVAQNRLSPRHDPIDAEPMSRRRWIAVALLFCAGAVSAQPGIEALRQQAEAAERAFARSMADRDHAAFSGWLDEQAVFFGAGEPLRGKAAVAAGWKRFFEAAEAPFSWAPDRVEVLADGSLAWSTGPVRDAAGKIIARFNSVWRQAAPGVWRVVFDKGQPPDGESR